MTRTTSSIGKRSQAALGRETFGGEPTGAISFFDLQPKTYQQEMLEQLSTQSAPMGEHRNLLVAATGTGQNGGRSLRLSKHVP